MWKLRHYDVIMSDADCTPGREPRSVAASIFDYDVTDCSGVRSTVEEMLNLQCVT